MEKIRCYRCKFYKMTWDIKFPYACGAFNFKSRKNPSLVVFEASGEGCRFFARKELKKEK